MELTDAQWELLRPLVEPGTIGNDIEADVACAQAAGLRGPLVRTGKFRSTDLEGAIRPDVVFDTIADLPRWWKGQCP